MTARCEYTNEQFLQHSALKNVSKWPTGEWSWLMHDKRDLNWEAMSSSPSPSHLRLIQPIDFAWRSCSQKGATAPNSFQKPRPIVEPTGGGAPSNTLWAKWNNATGPLVVQDTSIYAVCLHICPLDECLGSLCSVHSNNKCTGKCRPSIGGERSRGECVQDGSLSAIGLYDELHSRPLPARNW